MGGKTSFPTVGEVLESLRGLLEKRGFGKDTEKCVGELAEIILSKINSEALAELAFSHNGEKELCSFAREFFPEADFNRLGWIEVCLRLLCEAYKNTEGGTYSLNAADADAREDSDEAEQGILPVPTEEEFDALLKKYYGDGASQGKIEFLQDRLKELGHENVNKDAVAEKVQAIVKMYGKISLTPQLLAGEIVHLQIDEFLENGYEEAVSLIANALKRGKSDGGYFFAVRFCAMHNPEKFPLTDRCVIRAMKYYRDSFEFFNFSDDELLYYAKYKKLLRIFKDKFGLKKYSLADISRCLAAAGGILESALSQ